MTLIFRRGLFTDLLLDRVAADFAATPVLLGDGEAPGAGGWTGQQAGKGSFKPYVTLTTGVSRSNLTPALRGQDRSWKLTYTLKGVGGNRQQADFAADTARVIFSNLAKEVFLVGQGNAAWHILKGEYASLGDVRRNDATDPPVWECVDNLEIWLDLGP